MAAGTSGDVLICDREGPKSCKGHYMDYEMRSMDGAYQGRLHVALPFIGRKILTDGQQDGKDVHGFYWNGVHTVQNFVCRQIIKF